METQTENKAIAVPKPKHEGVKTTGGQLARLCPQSFGELEHMAQVLGKSDIVPKELIGKPANILLVLMFGNEIGLTAAQSLQNVMVVNGRPSLWGDAVMGLCIASNVYEDSKDSFDEKTMTATFSVKRVGKEWLTRTFSMVDAKEAGLDKKSGPWQQYKKRMLFHRARSWALRDTFPDVLKGLRYYEEERDIINLERTDAKVYEMPTAKSCEEVNQAAQDAPAAAQDTATNDTQPQAAPTAPESFTVERVTSKNIDGKIAIYVYIGGVRYETYDAEMGKAAKQWSESKTAIDFTSDKGTLVEMHPV